MDNDNDRQDRRAHRWPRNRQRERVLQLVREHDTAIDAAELAAQLGLHVTTVRFHLDALCDQGVVARTRIAPLGVGRPRTGYAAVQGQLDYRSFAEILALALGDTADARRRRAERAGRRWAERITADAAPESVAAQSSGEILDRRAVRAAEIFGRMGFGPELTPPTKPADGTRAQTIRLHACPVRELAAAHPEVGCALHLGLLEGLLADPRGRRTRSTLQAELEPFVEPELCIARMIARD